jgi:endonuclease YncB( thermonuclease family)
LHKLNLLKKEAFKKLKQARINANKVAQAKKKARIEAKEANKALQVAVRGDNFKEVQIEEKAQKQA